MTDYIGVDFGNAMIKAAAATAPTDEPRIVPLSEKDNYEPLSLRMSTTKGLVPGWAAFARRRRDGIKTATGMRDRWSSAAATASIGIKTLPATEALAAIFSALGQRIQAKANDPQGVAVAIPDGWDHTDWSLPVAAFQAGWSPEAYIREWCCALAMHPNQKTDEVLLVSWGNSGATGTLCRREQGVWKAIKTETESAVSGFNLRQSIAREISEEVIQKARRDPREEPADDQQLYDGIEAALFELHRGDSSAIKLNIAGTDFEFPVTRAGLRETAHAALPLLETLVDKLLSASSSKSDCPVIVWGELAILLGEQSLWKKLCPGGVTVASLDVVAHGAARLCAAAAFGGLNANTSTVCSESGIVATSSGVSSQYDSEMIPVCDSIPDDLSNIQPIPDGPAVLKLIQDDSETETRPIEAEFFRLGRDPQSDWAFADADFPTVSGAHAVVSQRDGQYILMDLGSANGTLINGGKLGGEFPLSHGDEIRLGKSGPLLRFERVES